MLGLRCYTGFSLVATSKGCSLVAVCRLLTVVASLVSENGLYGTQAPVAAACWLGSYGLNSCGLVALCRVESSPTRDRTHIPCVGRQILILLAIFDGPWSGEMPPQSPSSCSHGILLPCRALYPDFPFIRTPVIFARAAVPNLSGIWDWFHGRQCFHGAGGMVSG